MSSGWADCPGTGQAIDETPSSELGEVPQLQQGTRCFVDEFHIFCRLTSGLLGPLLNGNILERLIAALEGSVVHQDVEPTKHLQRAVDDGLGMSAITDVARKEQGTLRALLDPVRRLCTQIKV